MPKLCVVTASTNIQQAESCLASWGDVPLIIVLNGPRGQHGADGERPAYDRATVLYNSGEYLGTVPAFRKGVDYALAQGYEIICALHDDLELLDPAWAAQVIRHFERTPNCGLAGFGGAIGLGAADIYKTPYDPMQLARIGFRSNMVDAEAHGMRSLLTERVACLDGFSQIGRREFWEGFGHGGRFEERRPWELPPITRTWTALEDLGLRHHIYDGALGCLAARYNWETWFLPIRCKHYGGRTAVGDPGYTKWAETQRPIDDQGFVGDQGFWKDGHRIVYDAFRDVLPIRL